MKLKLFIYLIVFSLSVFAQEVIDKIVAVVDNEIITKSELDFQVGMFAAQRKLDPNDPAIQKQVLDAIIDEKLAYAQANIDSIVVTEEEVKSRIDYQIEMLKQQYGSLENIEKTYNMKIEKIRRELRENINKSIMIQKLQDKNFGQLEVSRREAEEFFYKYKDSLGRIPERLTLSHIYKNPTAGSALKDKYRDFAQAILDSVKRGANFEELAMRHSEDPGSAKNGGDLGFVRKGMFYAEFESAAYALANGEISKVVESPVGFHIIKLIEKRGETIHTKHILIKIKKDEEADLRAISFLNDIRDSIVRYKVPFNELAKKYSEDKETAVFGGDLGTFYMDQLDKGLLEAVGKLKKGDVSYPKRIDYGQDNYGYHIVWVKDRTPEHDANLEQDYAEIERMAQNNKRNTLYKKWVNELREKIYWEVRI